MHPSWVVALLFAAGIVALVGAQRMLSDTDGVPARDDPGGPAADELAGDANSGDVDARESSAEVARGANSGDVDARVGSAEVGREGSSGVDSGLTGTQVERQLAEFASQNGASLSVERSEEEVDECAQRLLERYRDDEACLLVSAGYLDLMGRTWGCVLQGPDWVDLCVASAEDDSCVLRTVRMELGEVPDA